MIALAFAALLTQDIAHPYAIRCGKLLDVKTSSYKTDQVIVVDDEKISSASGQRPSVKVPADAVNIDMSKGVCMPGLIDVHVHLTGDPSGSGYRGLGPRRYARGHQRRQKRPQNLAGWLHHLCAMSALPGSPMCR